jgi:hypothetical protein
MGKMRKNKRDAGRWTRCKEIRGMARHGKDGRDGRDARDGTMKRKEEKRKKRETSERNLYLKRCG